MSQTPSLLNKIPPELCLLTAAALWGSSFILLSVSLENISPGLLVTLRFGCAALLMAALMGRTVQTLTKTDWIAGFWAGTFIFFGYFLQTVGLQTIPSSISGFLTALYVPFTPLLQLLILRKLPSPIVGGGIAVAFVGMMLILDPTKMTFSGNFGEWITIASAVSCALEIIAIAAFAKKCRPAAFCLTQLTVVALWAGIYTFCFENWHIRPTTSLIVCLGILIGMVAFNQYLISWAQKFVSPARAVLIYTLEPVFAGLIGWCVGERIGSMGLLGGILVVASVLVSSWLPKYLEERKRS